MNGGTGALGRPPGSERAQTERRLFKAAADLFASRGYFGVGIREIATSSGFTVAALYHYVSSKEELLERMMLRALVAFTEGAEIAVKSSDEPAEQLAGLVEMSVIFHVTNSRTARVVDKEVSALGGDARARIVAIRDDYERIWTRVLERGVEQGTFRVKHIGLARLALLGMCAEVAYWYSPHGPVGIPELRDHFVDMALSLVQAPVQRPAALVREADIPGFSIEEGGFSAMDNKEGSTK